jgi:hypothetical protein
MDDARRFVDRIMALWQGLLPDGPGRARPA